MSEKKIKNPIVDSVKRFSRDNNDLFNDKCIRGGGFLNSTINSSYRGKQTNRSFMSKGLRICLRRK